MSFTVEKKKMNKFSDYIKEATIAGGTPGGYYAIQSDDDLPVGNIITGEKYTREMVKNRLTGEYPNYRVDSSDWSWDDFKDSKGMHSHKRYSQTLDSLMGKNSPIKRPDFDLWKHIKKRPASHDLETSKEKLMRPEQDALTGNDKVVVPDNPKTGQDDGDGVLKTVNKHIIKSVEKSRR